MKEYTGKELDDIVSGFSERNLEKSLWTHEAHIITAIWYVMNFEKEDAICRMRSGIISYNLAMGGRNTGQGGYHETMTVFWCEVVHLFVEKHKGTSFESHCSRFLQSPMADKNFPLRFYSKDYLLSPKARSRFVEPDLAPISLYPHAEN